MKQTVRFKNNPDAANRVAQHLYHVVQDGEQLIFSEFDEIAFKAAVALEGLARVDYRYVSDNPIPPPPVTTSITFSAFGRPRISLDLTLELPERHYHVLSLNVLSDVVVMSDVYGEFSLAIDIQFWYLIRILKRTIRYEDVEQQQTFTAITANLERARMQIRHQPSVRNAATCGNLTLYGQGNQSQSILLNLLDVSLNVNRSIF